MNEIIHSIKEFIITLDIIAVYYHYYYYKGLNTCLKFDLKTNKQQNSNSLLIPHAQRAAN